MDLKKSLIELKKSYGALAVKAEFEDEGACFDEVLKLKALADAVGLNFVLKIGGCGALNDLRQAKYLGVYSIVAPMIESAYAVKKFVQSVNSVYNNQNLPKLFINIETLNGYNNFDEILKISEFAQIDGVVLGRFDMSKSLGGGCSECDSDQILTMANDLALKCKSAGKIFTIGGGIKEKSVSFLSKLPYLCSFETRKVVFNSNIINSASLPTSIIKAIEFEIDWINSQGKCDEKRLNALKKRVESFFAKSF